MNTITMHGKLTEDAQIFLVNEKKAQIPMVVFQLLDCGLPYQKSEVMTIEVRYDKKAASYLMEQLKKNKEVIVTGFLRDKKWAKERQCLGQYYIAAENILPLPLYK